MAFVMLEEKARKKVLSQSSGRESRVIQKEAHQQYWQMCPAVSYLKSC